MDQLNKSPGRPDLPLLTSLRRRASPSGYPTVSITSRENGATSHFVAMQWLGAGERVYRHTHFVEETLMFLTGSGVATLDDQEFTIAAGTSLFIPAGARHGFASSATAGLCVVVVFPVPYFAETVFTGEDGPPSSS